MEIFCVVKGFVWLWYKYTCICSIEIQLYIVRKQTKTVKAMEHSKQYCKKKKRLKSSSQVTDTRTFPSETIFSESIKSIIKKHDTSAYLQTTGHPQKMNDQARRRLLRTERPVTTLMEIQRLRLEGKQLLKKTCHDISVTAWRGYGRLKSAGGSFNDLMSATLSFFAIKPNSMFDGVSRQAR